MQKKKPTSKKKIKAQPIESSKRKPRAIDNVQAQIDANTERLKNLSRSALLAIPYGKIRMCAGLGNVEAKKLVKDAQKELCKEISTLLAGRVKLANGSTINTTCEYGDQVRGLSPAPEGPQTITELAIAARNGGPAEYAAYAERMAECDKLLDNAKSIAFQANKEPLADLALKAFNLTQAKECAVPHNVASPKGKDCVAINALEELEQQLQSLSAELYNLSHRLMPVRLQELSVGGATECASEKQLQPSQLHVRLERAAEFVRVIRRSLDAVDSELTLPR